MDKKTFRIAFFLLLLVFISAFFVVMIRQFLVTILLAGIFSGLAHPLYSKLKSLFRGRRAFASAVTLLLILVLIVGPLIGFVGVLVNQAVQVSQAAGPWIQRQLSDPDKITELIQRLPYAERITPYREQIMTKVGAVVGTVGNFLVNSLSEMTRGTARFLFQMFILLYTMFFFLMDGKKLLRKILYYVPLSPGDEGQMLDRFVSVSKATIKGTLVIGVLQGTLAGIALAIVGMKGSVFWGTLMAVLSIIPGIGTALVWVPVAIFKLGTGQVASGIFLFIFCGLLVGSIDNVLRPRLVGRDVKMHDLLILFSTMGGLFLFGITGFIIGPILAALFVTVWEIYGVMFRDVLSFGSQESESGGDPTE